MRRQTRSDRRSYPWKRTLIILGIMLLSDPVDNPEKVLLPGLSLLFMAVGIPLFINRVLPQTWIDKAGTALKKLIELQFGVRPMQTFQLLLRSPMEEFVQPFLVAALYAFFREAGLPLIAGRLESSFPCMRSTDEYSPHLLKPAHSPNVRG